MAQANELANLTDGISPPPETILGNHPRARGYLAVSSGNITDDMIQQYIQEQEGEPIVDDSRFQIDPN
jgi:hypothetical protein